MPEGEKRYRTAVMTHKVCSHCGAVLAASASRCEQCGAVFAPLGKSGAKWTWPVVLALLVAGAALFGLACFLAGRSVGLGQARSEIEALRGEVARWREEPVTSGTSVEVPRAPAGGGGSAASVPSAAPLGSTATEGSEPTKAMLQRQAEETAQTVQRAVSQFHSDTGAYPLTLDDVVRPDPPQTGLAPAADGSVVEVEIEPNRYRGPYLSPPQIPRNEASATPEDPRDDWIYDTESAATLGQVHVPAVESPAGGAAEP